MAASSQSGAAHPGIIRDTHDCVKRHNLDVGSRLAKKVGRSENVLDNLAVCGVYAGSNGFSGTRCFFSVD